ncbi:F-box/kelch-repeat protein At3g06240-like [Rutidosis leptorrhynchoides]|uniref:F-box/kelch-repeat protein At3g06240-like n=1 Tax=Rutidosis leptorrhynchoides TaxID=125765 RepID=UPI003A99E447
MGTTISKQEKTIDDLPEDILLNVFLRLSIKTLGFCLCVKKKWLSIIKNPQFISLYTTNKTEKIPYSVLWHDFYNWQIFIDNDRFDFYKNLYLPDNIYKDDASIAVSDGVLCLAKKTGVIVLWNPTIQKTLTLPEPSFGKHLRSEEKYVLGFAFDSLANDYKVIKIICSKDEQSHQVGVFTLRSKSWKLVSETNPSYILSGPALPSINDALHWLGFSDDNIYPDIVGFDVNAEVFREFKLPNIDVNAEVGGDFECHHLELWVMKEYGHVESWTKIWTFSGSRHSISSRSFGARILGLRVKGEILWQMLSDTSMVPRELELLLPSISTNPESEEEKSVTLFQIYNGNRYFQESLLLLDDTNAVNEDVSSEFSLFRISIYFVIVSQFFIFYQS